MRLHVPVHLRWGDLDAYNHVNNVELMRLLEEARVRAFWRSDEDGDGVDRGMALIEAEAGSDTITLIARHEVAYVAPIAYRRAPLDVQLWISHLGGASLDVCYDVYGTGETSRDLYARAVSTIVLVDSSTSRPRRITDEERSAWSVYLGDPLQLGRKRD
ncbi:acyl-CoA thioester hydrolase [Labedella gwakjiensis]|uniref:Acyl-CoA thioester hydrolase n=1 Tax=Labedella gwakjiensis TaxID=390269 RepID=A0A2P8H0G3_9MICO|nr:thioesterase family protein [Labedella gwakjiensis]PSL39724.1 acyl-CoA thioester hydrolase [Labedella gwakjiensis]RUQ85890.1 acyl-CoA thioesterase [Labedella gwakjiensis]